MALAGIASAQHGVVTRSQALNAGLSASDISYRLRVGRLIGIHRGVYAVGHLPPSPHARSMAAVLACGPRAVLSHRSAGALYGLIRYHGPPEVTAPTKHAHPGIAVHRATVEPTTHYGIPTTTPARTLHDLARVLDPRSLTRAVNEARLRHLVRDTDLSAPPTDAPTRSVFEDAFLAFCHRHHIPRPEVNAVVHGYEVDMLWRPQRLIAELDGRAYHEHSFEADRERDAHLLAHGLRTVRITWNRLTTREATRMRHLLGLAGDRP